MIVIGTNDFDMYTAAVALIKCQGGKVVVKDGEIISQLPLPIAGLMSDKEFDFVVEKCDELNKAAHSIGCKLEDPFMTLGFLSLPVIPELKNVFSKSQFPIIPSGISGISINEPQFKKAFL